MEKTISNAQNQIKWKQSGWNHQVAKKSPAGLLMKHPRLWMTVVMFFADMLAWLLTISLIWVFDEWFGVYTLVLHPRQLLIVILYFAFAFLRRVYWFVGLNPVTEMKRVTYISSASVFLSVLIMLSFNAFTRVEIKIIFLLWFCLIPAILASRWVIRVISLRLKLWGEPVAMIASHKHSQEMVRHFSRRRWLGVIPVVVADLEQSAESVLMDQVQYITLQELLDSPVNRFVDDGIHTLLVDLDIAVTVVSPETNRKLFTLFNQVIFISDMEWIDGASLQVRDFESLAGIEFNQKTLSSASSILKRLMDIAGALVLGLLSAPVWLLAMITIKRNNPKAPMFYLQERIGKGGQKIQIIKFRTMVEHADQMLREHLALVPAARQEWEQTQKLRNDPRITGPGRWIRRYSVDELPQLLNIFKGDMSLVGPRPMLESQIDLYGEHFDIYCAVRPGLTGLWQVSGRNHTTFEERSRYDLYYARNWSIWLDVYILVRTVWAILAPDGAY